MSIPENKPSEPDNTFLKKFSKPDRTMDRKKKRDLLDGYVFRDSHEVYLNQYTKMVCSLFESTSKPGMFRVEQRIGYNRVVYDGNFLFVVAETLKELGKSFVPADLRPKEGLS